MSDPVEKPVSEPERRCPVCDTVVSDEATLCLMCGANLRPDVPEAPSSADTVSTEAADSTKTPTPVTETAVPDTPLPSFVAVDEPAIETDLRPSAPEVVESVMRERQAPLVFMMTAVFTVVIIVLGGLVWQYRPDEVSMVIAPSATPIPPTATHTPTWTPLPTETSPPTFTPTITPTPAPSDTPQPPRSHTVTSGQTLIGISFIYRVSPESIASLNGLPPDAQVQANQNLLIPWPTATPPLEIVIMEINGQPVLADPTDCDRYEVQSGDSISGIAGQFGVPFDILARVNRIENPDLLRPGDVICIPEVIYDDVALPPTPGPSPTPSLTPPPPGPHLLFPVNEAVIDPPDGVVGLQWTAVKDLTESEWYMVEVADMDDLDAPPHRAFTRDTAIQIPNSWRPPVPEVHRLRWRVSIVNVTGWRIDGLPIYTFGGESSGDAFFTWLGAIPTPTPTPTPTTTVTPEE